MSRTQPAARSSSIARNLRPLIAALVLVVAALGTTACEEPEAYESADQSDEAARTRARVRREAQDVRDDARDAVDDIDRAARDVEREAEAAAEALNQARESP